MRHTAPHFTPYFGSIFFASMGGGGGQNCFQYRGRWVACLGAPIAKLQSQRLELEPIEGPLQLGPRILVKKPGRFSKTQMDLPNLVDVSDSFYFFLLGEGEGGV